MPDDYPRLPQRRPSLRSVPSTERFVAAAPVPAPAPILRPQVAPDEGLLETMRKLWRHRRLIAACTIVLGGIAGAVAWSLPSYYVAEARVQVGIQNPRVFNAEAIITDTNPDAERVQNEGFVLQSRTLAKEVIDKLHLATDPNFNPELQKPSFWARNFSLSAWLPESVKNWMSGLHSKPAQGTPAPDQALSARENRLIDLLLSHIDVSLLGRSYVLSVKADSQDPNMAAALANTLAKTYLDYQRAEKIATMDKVDKFLLGRVNELREQVRKSDQAVEDYRRTHGLYKSSTSNVTAQQLTELNSQLIAAQTAKAEADSRLAEAQALSKSGLGNESVPEVLKSPLIATLKQQEADAERRMAEMSAMYGPRYPAMINARAEVANARAKIAAEIAKTVDGLAREARTADARYEAVRQDFERLKTKMGTVNDASIQLEALERDSTVNRNLLEAMLNRAKQSNGADAILQADAKLVSPAAPPSAPAFPPKALIAFLGLVGGFLIGAAIALLRESGDHTFRRADQLEALTGLPVLAMVPQLSGRVPPAMQVLRHPTSPYSEALRRVQIGVELSQAAASPKTMLFNSATPAEGKSVMVASLGRLLASNGRRVLLIDCDWRSPRLHQIFRCSNRDGLASLLGDKSVVLDDLIHHDALSGVDVLPSGNWSPAQAHLLSSDRMRQLLDALTPHYDFVILDTAPALVTADVLALSRLVDKVVFVVRWGHTRQDAVVESLKQIIDAQGDVAGCVLSRVVSKEYRRYGHRDPFYEYSRPIKATYS
ncbi:MAG: polysaccharide biosynthesis tyrosine autokinase [Proteobacteria bacterium]|nr:polysaccharide biosynthesis tyrosine autokinase [Pseudomonadota bacterium]